MIPLSKENIQSGYENIHKQNMEMRVELEAGKEKIRELKEFIDSHIENLNDVLFSVDLKGNFTYISPSIYNITGYEPEEVLGTPFMNYVHPDDLTGLLEEIDLTLKGIHHPFMFRIISKDGNHIYVHTSSRGIIKNGKIVGLNGIMVNIEKLKQVEFELKREKEMAHTYLDIAGVMIIAIDKENTVTLANKMACSILEYEENELLGNKIFMIFPEFCQHEVAFQLGKCKGQRSTYKNEQMMFEYPVITHNLDEKVCSWSFTPIVNNNQVEGYLLAGKDITRRKIAEEALLKAKILAEDANRTKSEFLTNMSHELRTPLNSVIGFSEVILSKDSKNLTDKQIKYLNNVFLSGKHLLTIINSILDLSKIESGDMTLKRSELLFPNLLNSVLKRLENTASSKGINILTEIDTRMQFINADKDKLEQSLYQIIDNSIKFTQKQGHINISAVRTDNFVKITISDDGIGISNEEMDRIFDPFVQVDSSTRRNYGGTGIGLALVKRYIEMHEGSIEIESEPGKGTCVKIHLPFKTDPRNLYI